MGEQVAQLTLLTNEAVKSHNGEVFKSLGDGVAAVFHAPHEAVLAAIEIQQAIQRDSLPKVRIGIYTGFAERDDFDYQGPTLNRVARITNLGHGGQILTTSETLRLASDLLSSGIETIPLGDHNLPGHKGKESIVQIHAGGLQSDFPRLRGTRETYSIPRLDRAFVGRVRERAEIIERVVNRRQRLVTILGFGGMGKSSLAQVCGRDVEPSFADGVCWVSCEGLQSEDQLVSAIADSLGCEIEPGQPREALLAKLEDQHLLLILDCCESFANVNVRVDWLLRLCPNLQILATSRIVFGSPFEYEFELQGLSDPHQKRPNLKDAVELFANTARQARGDFAVTKTNRKLLGEIVRDLECIPLAIILVASRLRYRKLEELAAQVKESVLKAAQSMDTKGGRHANLWGVIDLSFRMLFEEEQRVLTKLSVFHGGFFFEDADEVLQEENLEFKLARLRDNSMIVVGEALGRTRYRMLDSIREYVQSFESEVRAELARRHANQYSHVAEYIRALYDSQSFSKCSGLVAIEGLNLGQAIRWVLSAGESKKIAELAWQLCRVLVETGHLSEFHELAASVTGPKEGAFDASIRNEVLGLMAIVRRRANDLSGARLMLERRLEILSDSCARADCLAELIGLSIHSLDPQSAERFRKDYKRLSVCLQGEEHFEHQVMLARCAQFLGEADLAKTLALRVQKEYDFDTNKEGTVYISQSLAVLHRECGSFQDSISMGRVFLEASVKSGFKHRTGQALLELARSWSLMGREECAQMAYSAILTIPKSAAPSAHTEAKKHTIVSGPQRGGNWIHAAHEVLILQ